MDTSTPEKILANASELAADSAAMFNELYKHNPKVIKGKADSKFRGLAIV